MQIEPNIHRDREAVVSAQLAENRGSAIRIADGPWQGLIGILEQRLSGRERVLVLLDVLQRQTRVELPETWVRLA